MSLFLAVLVLGDAWAYVSVLDGGNVAAYVEASVDEVLSFGTILGVPNINQYNSYIRLGGDFDNTRAEY